MDEYLTPEELGKILKVNEKVIVDLLNSGDIPGIKIGYLWRIPKTKLEECFESNIRHAKPINFTNTIKFIKPTKKAIRPTDSNSLMRTPKNVMEKFLTCDDVAERYGVKKITIWSWIREKKLNAIQTGKKYRIRPEDLKAFEDARMSVQIISKEQKNESL
ncbi:MULTISPECIES: helix-turn-helix domain-containing protein [Pelosinus]|uniref:DNA binding domain protein, excisionase family n=1 Tax=Pelosinus fermentans B4 TaxID=1149862 RepID=I8RI49_9FIRM|nr:MULTISPECIES: helix-turn-helix domain-containing protein [Pelosinus]EIW19498.1 DNA binding domain protein, excisionase family [Pelosinus fermentans B4]EIW24769.1 DNA binding domain protein, excisionase family [Pelosinus fermentans A11]OAM95950.1 DNA binding domain protein, excisionase family [Pelosinus fermentans DSM 17108]SDR34663.1 DNA binding domain-containing protein, excisionase family [Pelosinus fermentans]